jgi:hypothetical protein
MSAQVKFQRVLTPKFTKDVVELKTFDMDLRTVVLDNPIRTGRKPTPAEVYAACPAGMNPVLVEMMLGNNLYTTSYLWGTWDYFRAGEPHGWSPKLPRTTAQ